MIRDALVKAGIPDVRGVWTPESSAGRMVIVVSIKQRYCGHSRQAAYVASQCQTGAYLNRYVIVVDEDIDPANTEEVMWAISTRSDPATDIDIMRKSWSGPIDPWCGTAIPPITPARSSMLAGRSTGSTSFPKSPKRTRPICAR